MLFRKQLIEQVSRDEGPKVLTDSDLVLYLHYVAQALSVEFPEASEQMDSFKLVSKCLLLILIGSNNGDGHQGQYLLD